MRQEYSSHLKNPFLLIYNAGLILISQYNKQKATEYHCKQGGGILE